ncbi:MAG: hypothetical protein ACKOQS_16615 [Dolichospermum sp.]
MIRLVFTDILVPEKQIHEVITNVQAKLESPKCQFFSLLVVLTGVFIVFLPLIVIFPTFLGV